MDTHDDMDLLRRAIRERVFITKKERTIIGSYGEELDWLFDFRAITLDAEHLPRIARIFWDRYESTYPFQVGGQESASIALIAAIVMEGNSRGKPTNGFFMRKSRKREGLMKTIEGTLSDSPIILVDDLINSGQTFNRQIEVLHSVGKRVSDIFAILAFRMDAAYPFGDEGIRLQSVFRIDEFGLPLLTQKDPAIPRRAFEVLWRFENGSPSFHHVVQKSAPVLDGTRVYFGSDRGIFLALRQSDGHIEWSTKIGFHPKGKGIFSTPALHQGVVYFGAYDGNVYALDTTTGKKKWVNMDADWVGSSPSLAPELGLLFIGLEFGLFKKRGGIAALSTKDGKSIWSRRMPELTHSSPLYIPEEGVVVIGGNEQTVYCFNAQTGSTRWTFKTEGDHKSSFAYDKKHRLLFFGTLGSIFYALSVKDGSVHFSKNLEAGVYSTPIVSGNTVYMSGLDKQVRTFDTATGEERWIFSTRGRIFASPVLAEGSLWVGSNDGCLYEIDPENGRLRSFFQATERIVNAIAYNKSTKMLFVPTVGNELYCLRKLGETPKTPTPELRDTV